MGTFEMMEGISPDEIRSQRNTLPANKEIGYHLFFDIKMDGKFTRRARLVANGHKTECVPKWHTYSSVVSCDSERIVFLNAALNNL